ncbi:hypothetical protein [Nocardia cyriacigeorgica]|uniref:hypothetical protein n=1 Tax=Nocardia cyriacigeorgica TaxID=135487 RepID=UPI002455BE38|nr:hypothetical protein [Nocardia cyriacigeorgica]
MTVTVTPIGQDWLVAFSAYNRSLLEILKSNVPHSNRKFDPEKREWRVSADVADLCAKFEQAGAKVCVVGAGRAAGADGPTKATAAESGDAEGWRQQYEALDLAAKSLLAENLRLREDLDELQRENEQMKARLTDKDDPAPVSGSWAEQLFRAVGRERRDKVHRALTKVPHPDLQGGSKVLMQQLNDARNS